ncbi:lysophospholipid acyltransferase 7 [Fopius arisanus]|uniref:Lysophospholipid acyltransferase 7 n=2 Tax=Fopius arisanus TaxID=64838 RepID=A0A0C9RSG6_9HYME|nr:PREDICTED: lysophospholipid acyltransferase 7 [Fopius arisanus]
MFIDDVIYLIVLLLCIKFGQVFRRFKDAESRQWISTGFGLFVTFVVSGVHILHPIISTVITAVLITKLSHRTRHIAAFFFTFFYLLVVFRLADWYGLVVPSTHVNLLQMIITLRLAGLGFEVNSAVESLKEEPNNRTYRAIKNIGFLDVFHFGLGYIGLLTGPYYTYRTYLDCIHRNLGDYIDCEGQTIKKLKKIVVAVVFHLLFNFYYPISYVYTEEFQARSLLYRYFYVYPSFFNFKTRIYAGMMLSECVCQMAGLGAYPTSCEPQSGLGPKDYKKYLELTNNRQKLKSEEIDFKTVHNIDIPAVERCFLVRHAMKSWNITVQYWMAAYVYKQFPSKTLRTAATFTISAVWHGWAFGYYVSLLSLIFFLPVEDLYVKFYHQSEENSFKKNGLWALLYFLRFSCMSYLGIGFQLLEYDNTVYYFTNIYAAGHVFVGLLYVIGRLAKPSRIVETDKRL